MKFRPSNPDAVAAAVAIIRDLAACPFCGGEASITGHSGLEFYRAYCATEGCGAIGPAATSAAKAGANWNGRAAPKGH